MSSLDAQFASISGASRRQALQYLSRANNNLELALSRWFDSGEEPEKPPPPLTEFHLRFDLAHHPQSQCIFLTVKKEKTLTSILPDLRELISIAPRTAKLLFFPENDPQKSNIPLSETTTFQDLAIELGAIGKLFPVIKIRTTLEPILEILSQGPGPIKFKVVHPFSLHYGQTYHAIATQKNSPWGYQVTQYEIQEIPGLSGEGYDLLAALDSLFIPPSSPTVWWNEYQKALEKETRNPIPSKDLFTHLFTQADDKIWSSTVVLRRYELDLPQKGESDSNLTKDTVKNTWHIFQKLPDSLWATIVEFSDWEAICAAKQVSKDWNNVLIQDISLQNQIPALLRGYEKRCILLQTKIRFAVYELQGAKKKFQLAVVTLTGKVVQLSPGYDWTTDDLKNAIQNSEGIPNDQQRLISAGKQLEDDKLLVEYNIPSYHTYLCLVLRLRGD